MSESKNENPAILPPLYQLYCGVDIAARSFTASVLKWQAGLQAPPDKASSYEQNEAAYLEFPAGLIGKGAKSSPDIGRNGGYW